MSRVSPVRRAAVARLVTLAGGASPPTRELSIAHGAIDAARAAGAAESACAELTTAESTLGYALDAHLEAQAATRAAAEGRVRARFAADERLDALAAAIVTVETALAAPEARRVPASARRGAEAVIPWAKAHRAVVRQAAEHHDPETVAHVERIMAELDAALTGLAPTPAARGRRR